jgi:ribosomal protein L11 methyltransferase
MGWLQLETDLGNPPTEELENLLEEVGAVAISLRDGGDNPLLEPAPGETPIWPTVILTALFPDDLTATDIRAALTGLLPGAALRFAHIAEQDWQANFEQELRPQQFGQRLWIIPTDAYVVPEDGITIVLSPGLAFGSGSHPTTAMCLEWLESLPLEGRNVLDYGCGSGILGLSAAALGAKQVTMTDIDPQALTATAENAANNNLSNGIRVHFPEKITDSVQHDVLVANILSGTLIELGPRLNGLMRPGASLAITGILADQAAQVCSAWSGWADMTIGAQVRQWVMLTGHKLGPGRNMEAGN